MLCLQVIHYPHSIYKSASCLKPCYHFPQLSCTEKEIFSGALSIFNIINNYVLFWWWTFAKKFVNEWPVWPFFVLWMFLLIMYEWNRSDIFFPLGFWPIMIYSRLEGGCECVQRRCHESRIPGRHNIYDIPSYVIRCHHNMFSCNLFLFKIKEFLRNAWNMTKHHHRGKYISPKLFIFYFFSIESSYV